MTTRSIDIPAPADFSPPDTSSWHRINCRLVTALYGGGVQSTVVDQEMPIRASSIRGQLRFWWRLLAMHQWRLGDAAEIRRQEFALWGGIGKSDDDDTVNKVFLRVTDVEGKRDQYGKFMMASYSEYAPKNSILAYVFFPADNDEEIKNKLPTDKHRLLAEGLTWTLHFRFAEKTTAEQEQQVLETLRWWGNFGGIGFRTRRGTGAVHFSACEDYPKLLESLSQKEVEKAGCQLVLKKQSSQDALKAWTAAVESLRDFRQKAHIGRNPPANTANNTKPAGRSRFPEPDAIRRISKSHSPEHFPEHPAGNLFPRGLFGMPIIFHFAGHGEPSDTQLSPVGKERFPSPLIIRPYHLGNEKWTAAALLLPQAADIAACEVELLSGKRSLQKVDLWHQSAAPLVRPIAENDADNPLQAFLHFFEN